MDFQKILNIILIIIVIYFIYRDFLKEPMTENFENITLGSADDQNAINKLAQISNDLLKGGVTVPGNMTVQGNIKIDAGSGNTGLNITSGNPYIAFALTGSKVIPQLYTDGKSLIVYDAPFVVNHNLTVGGTIVSGGRNILSELTGLQNQINAMKDNFTTNNLTVANARITNSTTLDGYAFATTITKGGASPDNLLVKFGDQTGWRIKFNNNFSIFDR